MKRKLLSILVAIALAVASIHPPQPVMADVPTVFVTGNPLTSITSPYLVSPLLSGQSACAISINTAGGAMSVEGHLRGTPVSQWTSAITTTSITDGATTQASQTTVGSYAFNCAAMDFFRADGTSASGTPSVTLTASGGVSRVLGRSGGGSSTTLTAGSGIAIANPSSGSYTISTTFTPSPAATAVSVVSGNTNTTVNTPSPGVFSIVTVTPAPPSISGTGIATVTNPSSNTYVVNVPSSAPIALPLSVANGGRGATTATAGQCDTASTSSLFATTDCAQYQVNSLVAPAVGSTVTMTANDGKLFTLKRYTPLFVSDGTTAIQGYANATVTNSSTVVMLETNVDQGAVGNTLAANSLASVSGLGSSGLGGLTAGTNIVISTPNPTKPTISTVTNPSFTGGVSTGSACVSGSGTGGTYNECPGYFQIGHAGGASNVTSTMVDSSLTITHGSDGGGDLSAETLHMTTGLTSGSCVQSTTGGLLASAAGGACPKTYISGSIIGGTHIEAQPPTGVAGASTSTFTFGAAYSVAPVCVASNSGSGNLPSMTVQGSSTTTNVTVYNSAATGVNYNVICVGF